MHSGYLFALAVAFGILAVLPLVPPGLLGPLGVLLQWAERITDRFVKPAAFGFLLATGLFAALGVLIQSWLEERLAVGVPFGTVRWVLMAPELGAWAVGLAWCTGIASFAIGTLKGWAQGAGVPPVLAFGAAALVAWYSW